MGYTRKTDKNVPNLSDLLTVGDPCPAVHFYCKKHKFDDIFDDEMNIDEWLDETWAHKSKELKMFAEHNEFPKELTKGATREFVTVKRPEAMAVSFAVIIISKCFYLSPFF